MFLTFVYLSKTTLNVAVGKFACDCDIKWQARWWLVGLNRQVGMNRQVGLNRQVGMNRQVGLNRPAPPQIWLGHPWFGTTFDRASAVLPYLSPLGFYWGLRFTNSFPHSSTPLVLRTTPDVICCFFSNSEKIHRYIALFDKLLVSLSAES
jgi:hypothetical protein